MKPYASNSNKDECSPISSNCVIWQGPNLQCINLCKGDSISDVTYKLALEICQLKEDLGLSDIDLSCLVEVCQTVPEPEKTLANILQLLANKVCCLADLIDNLPGPGNNYEEPILNLPLCLQYSDGLGGTVTQLIHNQYTLRIATLLCAINTTVNSHTSELTDHETRITILENATTPVLTINSCLAGAVQDIDVALENLEHDWCDYRTVIGTPALLTEGVGRQCAALNTDRQLATGLPMSALTGWKASVANVGQSLSNLWLTICDLRSAIKIIQSTCCQVDCNSIKVDFSYKWIDKDTLVLYFFPKAAIPVPFYDCDTVQGNRFTLTDGLGNEAVVFMHFRKSNYPADLTGIMDDLTNPTTYGYQTYVVADIGTTTPLDVTTGLVLTGDACFTNGDITCMKCVTKNIAAFVDDECCTLTAKGSATTITYKVCYTPTNTTTTTTVAP